MTDKVQQPNEPTELSVEYAEVALDQVLQYFVNGYKLQEGEITNHDAFIDTAKGKVIFRLYVSKEA